MPSGRERIMISCSWRTVRYQAGRDAGILGNPAKKINNHYRIILISIDVALSSLRWVFLVAGTTWYVLAKI